MTRVLSRDRVEARFRAMGRDARVVVLGGAPRLDERTRHLIEVLERKWSRFRSGGEITRVNSSTGRPVVVSPETFALVQRAVAAWRVTGGRFDPSVPAAASRDARGASPGCGRIDLDAKHRSVRLPAGVHLDVSGIAKGFATDLAVADLVRGGVGGALVSIGGDVRVSGDPPRPEGWFVDVANPFEAGSLGRLRLRDGAVCTCARVLPAAVAREARPVDRLVDPATGAPADNGVVSVTVVAGDAWWAQAMAKAAFLAGPEAGVAVLAEHGVTGLVVLEDGDIRVAPGLEAFT